MNIAASDPSQTNMHDGLFSGLMQTLDPVLSFLGDYPLVLTLIIIIVSLLSAWLLTTIINSLAGRLAKQTRIRADDQLVRLFRRPLFWTISFAGLLMALLPLNLSPTSYGVVQSIVATLLILLWTGFLLRAVRVILVAITEAATAGSQSLVRLQTLPLFQNLAFVIVLMLSIYLIFQAWEIDMTAWLASAGIVGIAVGFAAKDTLANLFSGVFILADSPYKIGDYVVLDSGERGKVTHIGIRSTRLLTRDDVEITIPNAVMGNTRITNESGGPYEKFRLRVKVGIAYGSDIDRVRAVLLDIADKESQVCKDPEARVRFRQFGGSSLDFELLVWVENPELRGRVLDALNTTIYKRFHDEGFEIPYSKHDIYIKQMPETKLD